MPDLLPPNATPQERAISLSVDRLPNVPIKTLWTPQTCPEAQLPWLAWALSVDDWDAAWPVETKRQVIADSIEQHRKKGTVGALRRALQRLGYEVEIDEKTGVAYTFRLRVRVRAGDSAGGSITEDALNQSVAVALRQKNARSALLETVYLAETDAARIFIGGVTMSGINYEAKQTADYVLPPASLTIEQTGASLVSLSWTSSAEYYEVEIYHGFFNSTLETGELVTSFTSYTTSVSDLILLPSVTPTGTSYKVKVRAFSGGRNSQWISETFQIFPIQPSDLAAVNPSTGALDVSWTNLEAGAEIQIRFSSTASEEGWGNLRPDIPTILTATSAQYLGLYTAPEGPTFYDVRVKSYALAYDGITTVYSDWTELLNIAVN